jgi:hypothetical protein
MSGKTIHLTVPEKESIPECIQTFSPEETLLMLKIGSECLLEGRKVIVGLTQKEIYTKIKNESLEQMKKLELDILVQKELSVQIEERLTKIYEGQVDQLKRQIEMLKDKIISYETENSEFVKKEVEKANEKFNILLQEKEKQVNKLNENYDNFFKLTNKSNSHKGSEGEQTFQYYADKTFKDFAGFEIEDKHSQGGEGDFHMHFDDFNILVDAKNYKKGIPSREREKIKNDLLKNEHIHFAWLVSLNTTIDKFDKSPIMFEWVSTNKCICYINNLLGFEDPTKMLRIAWFHCKELFKFIGEECLDVSELTKLKENRFRMNDKIKSVRKTIRELNTTIGIFKKQVENVDYELKDMLDTETNEIVESNFAIFDNWWNDNIVQTTEDVSLVSTDIWFKFRQDNKDCIKEFDITPDKFREFIKSKFPMTSYSIRNKSSSSAIDIKWIKWKNAEEVLEKVSPEMEVVEKEPKKKKVIKEKMISIKTEVQKNAKQEDYV